MEEDDQFDYLGSYGTGNQNFGVKGTGKARVPRTGLTSNTNVPATVKQTKKISTSAITDKTKKKIVAGPQKR